MVNKSGLCVNKKYCLQNCSAGRIITKSFSVYACTYKTMKEWLHWIGICVKLKIGLTWQINKKIKRERGQNFKLPDVWGMISRIRASFSKDWMGNAVKSVTLWASRQNGLLMPWLIVACKTKTKKSTSWPSLHSVHTANYVSVPELQSQGQGRSSVANCLFCENLTDISTTFSILELGTLQGNQHFSLVLG